MELRHLRYFVMVAEELNVSRAAARLHVSQPAISRQLHDLEDELGVKLFERLKTGIRLSEAGEVFVAHARDVLRRAKAAEEAMRKMSGAKTAPLRVGYLATALPTFLSDTLRVFATRYPHVEVDLREMTPEEQIERLREGAIDVALVGNSCAELKDEFEVRIARRIPMAVVLPDNHALARRKSIDLAELSGDAFIGLAEKRFPGRNELICALCQRAGFTPEFRAKGSTLSSVLGLVGSAKGVTLMPADAAALPHPGAKFVVMKKPQAHVDWAVVATRLDGMIGKFVEELCRVRE